MAASISQQLDDLLNPLPKFIDPEDDPDEDTKAKVIGQFDEGDDDDHDELSQLRKRSLVSLEESDWRYRGKPMSRKDLKNEIDGSADEDDASNEDGEEDEVGMSDKESLEEECDRSDIADDVEEDEEDGSNQSQMSRLVSKIKETNFLKLSEEMEGLEDDNDDDDDDDDDNDNDVEEPSDEEEVDSENISGEEEEHLDSALRTFSKEKVDEEVEKGKAVKNQLGLWDLLLERRIKLQKAVVTANQLPQPQTFADFKSRGGEDYAESLKNSHKALKALQRSLLELQDLLLFQNPETRPISQGHTWGDQSIIEDDEEIHSDDDMENEDGERNLQEANQNKPCKRKMAPGEYPDFMAKRYADFLPYRDSTLQKWYDKTQLTSGKNNKGFGAFDRNILTQVAQVLTDKDRLVRRTQTRRSDYRVLGKADAIIPETTADITEGEAADSTVRGNVHLKTQDEEIFDDDDFYHQLLRELIERKTSATDPNDQVAMGRQWLAIQKLRRKIKKKVDTKASKGRKIRFHVHSKLVNFMAPMDHSSMSDEARSELFRSLFADGSVTAR